MKISVGTTGAIIWFVLIIAAMAGWIMNIAALISTLNGPITAMFIARCVGVFLAPFGAIIGYF